MTSLERQALLGDKKAQEECTEKGIALLCPKCYGEVEIKKDYFSISNSIGTAYIICHKCGFIYSPIMIEMDIKCAVKTILNRWNKREMPPIGRCKECAHYRPNLKMCVLRGICNEIDGFCNKFKPKNSD